MSGERVRDLLPFVQVSDCARSVAFYERVGFDLEDEHEHDGKLDWAALESHDAQLMLAHAGAPIERDKQAVLFYLYADDLAALRDQLLARASPSARSATAAQARRARWVSPTRTGDA